MASLAPRAAPVVAAQRGELRLADRVFDRIAGYAVQQSLTESWAGRAERGAPPRVSVRVVQGVARISLHLDLPFPADLAELARIARRAAAAQVAELTGTPVGEVVVVVERLLPVGNVR
ncbi:hypothetical protein AB0K43_05935 [Kitasatospora sp. NPDC049258]|uniref:hypothetical protein n=1 Tax=Kitasatospora sp. NPDC049258 TaxID=3155394 RepID=UPI003445AC3D